MPSPFPGMDPWLEHASLWPDVHRNLISVYQELLVPLVAPHYYVRGEERVYIADGLGSIEPDVSIAVRWVQPALVPAGEAVPYMGGPAPDRPTIFPLVPFEDIVRDRYLEIRERGTHRVVTIIEILSPANKIKGTPRYQRFVKKRTEVLSSDVHWIEVDLLRSGTRWQVVPGQSDYCVVLSRAEHRQADIPTGEAWLFNLPDRLPVIPIPLRPPHPDVSLDLQKALDMVYDRAGYALSVDYAQPPDPPLSAEAAAWAEAVLRENTTSPSLKLHQEHCAARSKGEPESTS